MVELITLEVAILHSITLLHFGIPLYGITLLHLGVVEHSVRRASGCSFAYCKARVPCEDDDILFRVPNDEVLFFI